MSNYNKKDAIISAIRSLSPDVIICDEIGSENDLQAIKRGANSGVKFIVSLHADNMEEFYKKYFAKKILSLCVFDKVIFLDKYNPGKISKIVDLSSDGLIYKRQ